MDCPRAGDTSALSSQNNLSPDWQHLPHGQAGVPPPRAVSPAAALQRPLPEHLPPATQGCCRGIPGLCRTVQLEGHPSGTSHRDRQCQTASGMSHSPAFPGAVTLGVTPLPPPAFLCRLGAAWRRGGGWKRKSWEERGGQGELGRAVVPEGWWHLVAGDKDDTPHLNL